MNKHQKLFLIIAAISICLLLVLVLLKDKNVAAAKKYDACVVLKQAVTQVAPEIVWQQKNPYQPDYQENKYWYSSCQFDDANNPLNASVQVDLKSYSTQTQAETALGQSAAVKPAGEGISQAVDSAYSKGAYEVKTVDGTNKARVIYYAKNRLFIKLRVAGDTMLDKLEQVSHSLDDALANTENTE